MKNNDDNLHAFLGFRFSLPFCSSVKPIECYIILNDRRNYLKAIAFITLYIL